MINNNNKFASPIGDDCEWDELKTEIFSPEEIAAGDLRVAIISEIINARQQKNERNNHDKQRLGRDFKMRI